jgi:hypothetical protein
VLMNGILNLPGLYHMGPELQRKMTALFNLRGDPVFDRVCDQLRYETRTPQFMLLSPEQQAQQMSAILHRSDLIHGNVPDFGVVRSNISNVSYGNARWDDGRKHFQTAGAPPRAVVQHLTMQIGKATRDFDVVFPESWPIDKQRASMAELASTLQTLPPEALSNLERIVMNPERNPSDSFWEKEYKIPGFESHMTAHEDTRSITVYPATSIPTALQKFVHEVGHLVSVSAFGNINGNGPGWDAWKNASSADVISVSRYAQKSPAEDFAETFALYTTTKGTARHDEYRGLMPHRFAILDEIARQAELG